MHILTRRMNSSHAHLPDSLPFHSCAVRTILPAVLKMRVLLSMWQVNSHTPLCGHCPVDTALCTLPSKPRRRLVHTFIGAPIWKSSKPAHITSESTLLSVLLLFVAEIITLLVVETNRYFHKFLDNSDDGTSPKRDMTEADMFAFLAMTSQMGHAVQERLEDCWTKMKQFCTPFYVQTMARTRYCHILRSLHFTDNNGNGIDKTGDRL
jgi:hypothetical protein